MSHGISCLWYTRPVEDTGPTQMTQQPVDVLMLIEAFCDGRVYGRCRIFGTTLS